MIGKQLHISGEKTLSETVEPVRNSEETAIAIKKPGRGTGLWTSTWHEETQASGWIEWCRLNDFGSPEEANWFLLTPKPDVRLYTIDSHGDLIAMLARFRWDAPSIRDLNARYEGVWGKDYIDQIGIPSIVATPFIAIDFERMAQEFDGIHLTEQGNEETHLSYPHDLNAWDCESILWFRWKFERVEKITPVRA